MPNPLKIGLLTFFITLISGCDLFKSDLDKLSDNELRAHWKECQYIKNASQLKTLACDNYEKQCDQRKSNGNLACY